MTKEQPRNLPASVRQRLLNLSRQQGGSFDLVLTRFALERLLYRLNRLDHLGHFVLKGAMLFAVWTGRIYRPTRDLDLLGFGDPDAQRLASLFQDVCRLEVEPDGMVYDPESVQVTEIREGQEYQGQRVKLVSRLAEAKLDLQIDIGFGDAITPGEEILDYPTLLDFPAPRISVYPKETVIAEKFQAMVALGAINSRMKDFFDIWTMSQEFYFSGPILVDAIRATFSRRGTLIPQTAPFALGAEFSKDPVKDKQWQAFLRRNAIGGASLSEIIAELHEFLMPPLQYALGNETFSRSWQPSGPWMQSS